MTSINTCRLPLGPAFRLQTFNSATAATAATTATTAAVEQRARSEVCKEADKVHSMRHTIKWVACLVAGKGVWLPDWWSGSGRLGSARQGKGQSGQRPVAKPTRLPFQCECALNEHSTLVCRQCECECECVERVARVEKEKG